MPVQQAVAVQGEGLKGDAHAAMGGDLAHRQISLLANESAEIMRQKGVTIGPGDFAENILTSGIEVKLLPIGTRLKVGEAVVLEVTQIGKECHQHCAIYQAAGDCVMPREGIFAIVIEEGAIKAGDSVDVV